MTLRPSSHPSRRAWLPRLVAVAVVTLAIVAATVLAPHVPAASAEGQVCGALDVSPVDAGRYTVQNNRFGTDEEQCVTARAGGFTVDAANGEIAPGGPPKSYPSIVAGCHWGRCTDAPGLPVRASEVGGARTAVSITPAEGSWNAAYDVWFNSSPGSDGQSDGTEIMIWIDANDAPDPIGAVVGTLTVEGAAWTVWQGNIGWDVVSFVREQGATTVDLALGPFVDEAVERGATEPDDWMTSVQFGFEPWSGGEGLAVRGFSFTPGDDAPAAGEDGAARPGTAEPADADAVAREGDDTGPPDAAPSDDVAGPDDADRDGAARTGGAAGSAEDAAVRDDDVVEDAGGGEGLGTGTDGGRQVSPTGEEDAGSRSAAGSVLATVDDAPGAALVTPITPKSATSTAPAPPAAEPLPGADPAPVPPAPVPPAPVPPAPVPPAPAPAAPVAPAAPAAPAPAAPAPAAPAPAVPGPRTAATDAALLVHGPSGLCLDARGSGAPGDPQVALWTCDAGQSWTPARGALVDGWTGACLGAVAGARTAGTGVQLQVCDGHPGQRWQPTRTGALLSPASGLCLTTRGGASDGTPLVLGRCQGAPAWS